MTFSHIAHYGGYLTATLDKYSRRQLKTGYSLRKDIGAKNILLTSQKKSLFSASERLLNFEERHVKSWLRLIDASKISRRARKATVAA